MVKKSRVVDWEFNPFDLLSDEILFDILDYLDHNPFDKKSFSLVCKDFYRVESRHRRVLKPLRSELLIRAIDRYPSVERLDLSSCPRITDDSLAAISNAYKFCLRSIDLSRSRFFSNAGVSNVVVNCKFLVEIDLSNATELTDSGAVAISKASNLEKLWLARCKLITDIGIARIGIGCRKLKLINLTWCLGVGDLGVDFVAVKCKEIRSFDLSYTTITNKCLPSILNLQYLEELTLVGCLGIGDEGLATLEKGRTSLKTLNLTNCDNVTLWGLPYLTSRVTCLSHLNLTNGSVVTEAIANSLQNLPKLQSIKLDGCHVTCSGLEAIGNRCILLRELSLSKCSGVTDEGLSFLVKKQKELRKLDITCCRKITQISVDNVTKSCTSLTSLKMESCYLISKEAFTLIGERCHHLEEIDLTDTEVDDAGLMSISRCKKLSSLRLGICYNLTDNSLIQVGKICRELVELDLYRSMGITDLSIAAIASGCPRLEMITLAYCKDITDTSLVSLSKCSRLSVVEIRGCSSISSAGISTIALGCKQLTVLDVKKCHNVDDAGLLPLTNFSRSLRQINLSYCSITDVGLLALANIACLQSMTVLHLKGLSADGLVAALLACSGLRKVKLHASFKSLFPQPFLEHMESRGCLFQWRDKPVQDGVDPWVWRHTARMNANIMYLLDEV
ncbi:hypothetical protein Scep_005790 [Stephania cephalantha]|uniref:F-box/LRR-repeat protein 15-like leucin rich repeat domain-containing protein n=1 Tax=Stephania cephalantha TaxID=152367 RepID=A0AAP0KV04_9MAGN